MWQVWMCLRVIVVLSIGDKIFSDDQSKFSCDTSIPGCSNMLGSEFRWNMQLIRSYLELISNPFKYVSIDSSPYHPFASGVVKFYLSLPRPLSMCYGRRMSLRRSRVCPTFSALSVSSCLRRAFWLCNGFCTASILRSTFTATRATKPGVRVLAQLSVTYRDLKRKIYSCGTCTGRTRFQLRWLSLNWHWNSLVDQLNRPKRLCQQRNVVK